MSIIRTVPGLLAALLAAGCSAKEPGSDVVEADAAPTNLQAPILEAPEPTPLETVPIRGKAVGASTVVVRNDAGDTETGTPLPDGSFCIDAPIVDGSNSFEVIGVANDGRVSEPATISAARDPGAEEPSDATCRDLRECAEDETACSDGSDDDCNGLTDRCDPACNGCDDDPYEPNDTPFGVPILQEGAYPNLRLCPCREDWYAFEIGANVDFSASINFIHAQGDLDLWLMREDEAQVSNGTKLATSTGVSDFETVSFHVNTAGTYYLRVFSPSPTAATGYSLSVSM